MHSTLTPFTLLIKRTWTLWALICIAYSPTSPQIFCSIVTLKCQTETRQEKEQASVVQRQVITTPPSITILIDFQPAIYIREVALYRIDFHKMYVW